MEQDQPDQHAVRAVLTQICEDAQKATDAALLTFKDGFFEEPKDAARAMVRFLKQTEVLSPELQAELLRLAEHARDAICDRDASNWYRIYGLEARMAALYRRAAEELLLLDL